MKEKLYVALLRGVNVGGNNIMKMADVQACFELSNFSNVSTFIQSGNILFSSSEKSLQKLTTQIEKILSKKFNYKSQVVIISHNQLSEVVRKAPKGFGSKPLLYRSDVIFLKPPLTAPQAVRHIQTQPGVDQAYAGRQVLYFARLASKASKSKLVKIIGSPVYQSMTIRNWNTTTKLLALLERSLIAV